MTTKEEDERYQTLALAAYNDSSKMGAFISEISENPAPLFADALRRLTATCDHVDDPVRPPANIVLLFEPSPAFDAFTNVQGRSITFRKGVISLVRDIAELHCSYEALYAFDGTVVRPPALTHAEIVSVVSESVKEFAYNKEGVWREPKVLRDCYSRRLEWDQSTSDTRKTSVQFFARLIVTICFIMAHEVGHIIEGRLISNPFRRKARRKDEELKADRIAARAILDYISIPPTIFAQTPPAPSDDALQSFLWAGQWYQEQFLHWREGRLEDLLQAIAGSGNSKVAIFASEHSATRSYCLAMLSLFFNVFRLVELARERSGSRFSNDYPDSDERYDNLRVACLAHPLSPSDLFSAPHGRRGPLDDEHRMFRKLFEGGGLIS
jgi:hypothetical protein